MIVNNAKRTFKIKKLRKIDAKCRRIFAELIEKNKPNF